MLNQPTIEKLHTMKMHGMADAFRAQLETTESHQLSFEERFALLVDQQWLWKENRALGRRLRCAKLKQRAVIEDVNYQHPRELDRRLLRTLASSQWVRQKLNLVFTGPTGIGKSWLACALAQKACREGFSAQTAPQGPILFPQPLLIDQKGKTFFETELVRLGSFQLSAEGIVHPVHFHGV